VASGAFSELRELVETLGIPVLTTLSGRSSLPDDHPLAGGGLGVHRTDVSKKLLGEADFVLGLGARFEQMETNWRAGYVPAPDACYVQIDSDPAEIGRSVVPRLGIVSDIKMALGEMTRLVRESGGADYRASFRQLPRVQELLQHKEQIESDAERDAASNETPMTPLRAIMEIREAFPRETTVAIDIGQHAQHIGGAFPYFKVYEPRSVIPCTSFYAMGYASLALPVARLVYPERPAVGMCGDGSFQMAMNILPVAAQYRLGVTWCVLADGALGSIQEIQELSYGGRVFATSFDVQPDFAKLAEACQCYGEKVEDPRQLRHALGRAIEANNRGVPAVLDIVVKRKSLQASSDYSAR
jgi:acetolactate synthase-1/2/3 large subunit